MTLSAHFKNLSNLSMSQKTQGLVFALLSFFVFSFGANAGEVEGSRQEYYRAKNQYYKELSKLKNPSRAQKKTLKAKIEKSAFENYHQAKNQHHQSAKSRTVSSVNEKVKNGSLNQGTSNNTNFNNSVQDSSRPYKIDTKSKPKDNGPILDGSSLPNSIDY